MPYQGEFGCLALTGKITEVLRWKSKSMDSTPKDLFIFSSIFLTKNKICAYCIGQKINDPTTNGDSNQIAEWMFYFSKSKKSKDNNNKQINY